MDPEYVFRNADHAVFLRYRRKNTNPAECHKLCFWYPRNSDDADETE